MRYDRPVRELLADCVAGLPQPFAKADVLRWFGANYPDVAPATVNTHVAGMTAGRRPHEHLSHYPPVMERVGRGLYRRIAEDGGLRYGGGPLTVRPAPKSTQQVSNDTAPSCRIVLIGCVRSKRATAAPAKDLYTSPLFAKRRRYAEAAGDRWYIVSGRLGLVGPDEAIAPYELYLPKMSARYRAAWGSFVAAQLAEIENLASLTIEVHAGDAYVDALRRPLEAAGATVIDAVDARSFGATLAWYDRPSRSTAPTPGSMTAKAESANVETVKNIARALADESAAESVPALLARPKGTLRFPGMYSWWVDTAGAEDLSKSLGLGVASGLIYVGQAGATRWPSGRQSTNTLWGRLVGMHLGGRAQLSTFRLTLASILQPVAGHDLDETALTDWMTAHLAVVVVLMTDGERIGQVETSVLAELDPPLNLAKRPPTPLRRTLSELRKERGIR